MDQKTWLWRKKSSEKTILATLEEAQSVSSEKEIDLENSLKILNEKLASAVDECSAKDELVENYKKEAEVAAADKQKADEDIRRLKQELDEAQHERSAANERLGQLNSTLKDSMEQLSLVRQEQERRMHDAVMKTSQEFEKSHKKLEEKLTETSKRAASLTSENSYLSKALTVKERLIENLNSVKIQTESELETLMTRLDSVEKENAFLRYEYRSLEKELQLRNDELEYSRRSAEASNKNYLENVKKIKKLEGECQRLRALTRKRLPAPSILANMHRDMEAQRANQITNTSKQISFLIDQVQDLQRENEIFKEFLAKKDEELLYLQKLKNVKHTLSNPSLPDELSATSDDPGDISSRALALVSGNEHDKFKEMSLMDDFVEMEKLAIVAVDSPLGASDVSSKETPHNQTSSMTKDLVLVGHEKTDDWLEIVTNMILEQHNASRRSIDELLEDVRMSSCTIRHPQTSPISGYLTWKSPASSPTPTLIQESPDMNRSIIKLIELIGTFGLSPPEERSMGDDLLANDQNAYEMHVFRWRKRDITAVLQEFIDSCNKLLDGKISYEKFTSDLAYVLGWIINSCISFQEHSTVREEFRKHLGGDGPGTALELESVQNLMLEMEKMHSVFQVEIKGLKNELSFIRSSSGDLDISLQSGRQNNEALLHKLVQSQQGIASLQKEMDSLKESKRMSEEQLEDLKVVNEDLETQLTVTTAKLNQLLKKLSSAEVELDNKSQCCEELEGTCLELQLQLESIANSRYSENHENQEGLLQTGIEITKASAKLAECEETMMKLGKQLKALGSAKETSVVDDKSLSISDSKKHKLKQRPSLLDQMMSEDNGEESPKTKEIISTTQASAPSVVFPDCGYNAISFPDGRVSTPATYLGIKNETKNFEYGALAIVPSKKRGGGGGGGGTGFLRKLLLRRKKASIKNTTIHFGK